MKKLLESGYMESEYSMIYLIFTRQQLGDVLGNLGFHRKAICFDKETLNLCQERQELRFQAELYYDIFWNYKMIREKETLTKKEENDCRQCLIHAYYINEALSTGKEIYKRALEKYYGITM